MNLVAISDLHGYLPEIPECDILLIAGDVCPIWDHDRRFQADWLRGEFSDWLRAQPAKSIIGVGGNHDFVLRDWGRSYVHHSSIPWTYLLNESIEIDGVKIWGSPYSPTFGGWAFMRDDYVLHDIWETIPPDTDIVLVHGPPYGYGDLTTEWMGNPPQNVGSRTLRERIRKSNLPSLKYVICGHIHPGRGEYTTQDGVKVINATYVDNHYDPVYPPIIIEI